MKTCKEMAKLWGVTERTVTTFCKTGKIPGAVKEGKSWRIPDEAEKPVDGRVLSGKYVKKEKKEARKPLPIGISDYVRAQSEYYYVDKTGMIKEFLDRKPLVSLFTRPRRFGKTLNMDMLRVFFEISDTDTSQYFRDKEIWKCGEEYREHQGKYPVIFLTFKDIKFDAPIQEGYSKKFYEEIVGFMWNFFSGAFKDNRHLSYGFLTGILRIAQESIFSGLNNPTVNSILDETYDKYFGFTRAEVHKMLRDYGALEKEAELKTWYDGYLFGAEEVYNPWSVVNYIAQGCIPKAYWVNTGKNEILEEVLKAATEDVIEKLYALLQGERVVARIDQNVVYRSLLEEPSSIYSLLLVAGYLKTPKKELQTDGSYLCEVSIPNWEIAAVYKAEILSHLLQIGAVTRTTADRIAESLYTNDVKKLQSAIAEYMDKSISFYDAGAEGFYHGLVLGLIALLDQQYKITSNREFGEGRYDISLFPRELRYPGILMELKWKKGITEDTLKKLAKEALNQIETQRYDAEMRQEGVTEVIKLGIAFSGKNVKIWTV